MHTSVICNLMLNFTLLLSIIYLRLCNMSNPLIIRVLLFLSLNYLFGCISTFKVRTFYTFLHRLTIITVSNIKNIISGGLMGAFYGYKMFISFNTANSVYVMEWSMSLCNKYTYVNNGAT